MISGANLLDYQEKYSTFIFFKKRLIRVVLPFVAWSFIGIIYRIIYDGWNIPGGWTIFVNGKLPVLIKKFSCLFEGSC